MLCSFYLCEYSIIYLGYYYEYLGYFQFFSVVHKFIMNILLHLTRINDNVVSLYSLWLLFIKASNDGFYLK